MERLTELEADAVASSHYYPGEPIEMNPEETAPETHCCADCGMPITTLIYRLRAADLCRACAIELAKSLGEWFPGREERFVEEAP